MGVLGAGGSTSPPGWSRRPSWRPTSTRSRPSSGSPTGQHFPYFVSDAEFSAVKVKLRRSLSFLNPSGHYKYTGLRGED
jgi:hypothetical protein